MAKKFRNKYRIEPNRWAYWDYSSPGSYFITICTHDRACVFGKVQKGKMILSPFGEIVENEFRQLDTYHPRAILDIHVVMPNHVHCIITLGDYGFDNGLCGASVANAAVEEIHEFPLPSPPPRPSNAWWNNPDHVPSPDEIKQYRKYRRSMIIPKMIGKFKMQTSRSINILRDTPETPNWQPNYHDHVIRNRPAFERIKRYIILNPEEWEDDTFYEDGEA